jgi:hypothetical protein
MKIKPFPVEVNSVYAYLSIFHCQSTAQNYIAHLKNACVLEGLPTSWDNSDLRMRIRSVNKSLPAITFYKGKQKLALSLSDVNRIVAASRALEMKHPVFKDFSCIVALSFSFLFRVPSECLPLSWNSEHSSVVIDGDKVHISLTRRKNKPAGQSLTRLCACANGKECLICPVHAIRRLFQGHQASSCMLFKMNKEAFVKHLNLVTQSLNIEGKFGSHALRRGAAREIWNKTKDITRLRAAGAWSGLSFMPYLDEKAIAADTVANMLIDDSDDE